MITLHVLSIEVNNLLQIELEQRRDIIVHEPQHVLEQNGIHIHKDHPPVAACEMQVILLRWILLHGDIHQKPKRVLLQDERVHQEHPPLFPNHHRHGALGFLVQPIIGQRPVSQTRTCGAPPDQCNWHHQTIHRCKLTRDKVVDKDEFMFVFVGLELRIAH